MFIYINTNQPSRIKVKSFNVTVTVLLAHLNGPQVAQALLLVH